MLGRCSHFAQRWQDAWGQVQQGARVMKGKDQALCRLQPLQCKQKWDHGGLDFQTVSGNWKSSCRIPVLNVRSKQGKRSPISPWSRLGSAPGTAGWALKLLSLLSRACRLSLHRLCQLFVLHIKPHPAEDMDPRTFHLEHSRQVWGKPSCPPSAKKRQRQQTDSRPCRKPYLSLVKGNMPSAAL